MKIVDGEYVPECIAEQEALHAYRQQMRWAALCDAGRQIEQMTSNPNEQILLKQILLKNAFDHEKQD